MMTSQNAPRSLLHDQSLVSNVVMTRSSEFCRLWLCSDIAASSENL